MDAMELSLIIFLFSINYGVLLVLWKKMDNYSAAIKIICREHAANHGGKEIGL